MFNHDAMTAKLELIAIIKNLINSKLHANAFGIFYNSLVHSNNLNVAKLLLPLIDENDIETANEVVVKSSVNKSKTKILIIQQIDRKVDLEEIAEKARLSFEDLLTEIENICYSGTKLNLNYYIDQVIDAHKQDDIHDYFMNAETDSLDKALGDRSMSDYSEEEVRMMRIKFMSEYAN